ncbi:MAG: flagellar basal body L-ring protein FlgH [Pseudobdellovibrio sp.]
MIKKYLIVILNLVLFGCVTSPTEPTPVPVVIQQPAPVAPVVAPTPAETVAEVEAELPEKLSKYSEVSNMPAPSDRSYRRMTRQKMEEESDLQASAGSLWKMDGQASYLFAQNKHRTEGDPTSIKLEGAAIKQIESKVAVVQDLINELEIQKLQAEEDAKKAEAEKLRLAEIEKLKPVIITDKNDPNYDAYAGQYPGDLMAAEKLAEEGRKPAAVAEKKPVVPPKEQEKIDLKDVESVPAHIVERMQNGMYRISGQQTITIKKRPYKVIATGLVRPEDFDDNSISSVKLLEPQYDVIHMKRTE